MGDFVKKFLKPDGPVEWIYLGMMIIGFLIVIIFLFLVLPTLSQEPGLKKKSLAPQPMIETSGRP